MFRCSPTLQKSEVMRRMEGQGLISSRRRRERVRERERRCFERVVVENFPELLNDTRPQIRQDLETTSRIIIRKLRYTKEKEKSLNLPRRKRQTNGRNRLPHAPVTLSYVSGSISLDVSESQSLFSWCTQMWLDSFQFHHIENVFMNKLL